MRPHMQARLRTEGPGFQKAPPNCLSLLLVSTNQDEALPTNQHEVFFLLSLINLLDLWDPERELSLPKQDFLLVGRGQLS